MALRQAADQLRRFGTAGSDQTAKTENFAGTDV